MPCSLAFLVISGCRSDFFLRPENYKGCTSLLVQRFGELVRRRGACVAAGSQSFLVPWPGSPHFGLALLIRWLDFVPSAATVWCPTPITRIAAPQVRKTWNPRAFKGQVSPHEFMQVRLGGALS